MPSPTWCWCFAISRTTRAPGAASYCEQTDEVGYRGDSLRLSVEAVLRPNETADLGSLEYPDEPHERSGRDQDEQNRRRTIPEECSISANGSIEGVAADPVVGTAWTGASTGFMRRL